MSLCRQLNGRRTTNGCGGGSAKRPPARVIDDWRHQCYYYSIRVRNTAEGGAVENIAVPLTSLRAELIGARQPARSPPPRVCVAPPINSPLDGATVTGVLPVGLSRVTIVVYVGDVFFGCRDRRRHREAAHHGDAKSPSAFPRFCCHGSVIRR